MPVLPAEVPTGLVTGQYYFVSADMVDPNTDPDMPVVTGVVRFTCSAPELRMVSKKAVLIPLQFEAKFNGAGQLVTAGDATPGVKLPAISPLINPDGFTWWVDFHLTGADGYALPLDGFPIKVIAGQETDLSEAKPVEVSPGYFLTRGPQGETGDSIVGPPGEQGEQGDTGPANKLSIGTVAKGDEPAATITGEAPAQTLNLVLPKGDRGLVGPPPNLTIGKVETVSNPADGAWVAGLIRGSADVTGALRETFPSTMKGDKGDAGGWNIGTNLGTTNLNTVLTPGLYRQEAQFTNMVTAANYPLSATGVLEVTYRSLNRAIQKFYPQSGGGQDRSFWTRSSTGDGTTWTAWVAYATQRVDNTAGRAIYTWDDTANREQLIYGDTGWRQMPLDIPSLSPGSLAFIRRTGSTVTISIPRQNIIAPQSGTVMAIPAGFRSSVQLQQPVAVGDSFVAPAQVYPQNNELRIWWSPSAGQLSLVMTYITSDTWPTSLPGTAVGAIPNL